MNTMRAWLMISVFLCAAPSHAAAEISADSKALASIEKELKQAIAHEKPDAAHLFHIYRIAGREFQAYGFLKQARSVYEKALAVKTDEDPSEPIIQLLQLDYLEKNLKEQKRHLAIARARIKNSDLLEYVEWYEKALVGGEKGPERFEGGLFGAPARWSMLEKLMREKKFNEAFALINPKGVEQSSLPHRITYDLLNVLVNRRKAGNLFCADDLKKYPDAYSYSIRLCKILSSYIEKGAVDPAAWQSLESFFKENNESAVQDKRYLVAAAEELKK